jgi:hypothetical protein
MDRAGIKNQSAARNPTTMQQRRTNNKSQKHGILERISFANKRLLRHARDRSNLQPQIPFNTI